MRVAHLIGPELEALLKEAPSEISEIVHDVHPEDLSDLVEEWSPGATAELFRRLPATYSAQVFGRIEEDLQLEVFNELGIKAMTAIALEMDSDERADFISGLPDILSERLLASITRADPEVAEDVEELTRWPEESAGALMTTDFVAVTEGLTVQQAIEELRICAREAESIDSVYVVDEHERLIGVAPLRALLLNRGTTQISEVMRQNIISVLPTLDQEEVARILGKYDFDAIPVLSDEGILLGIITADDVIDVLAEEHEEDVQKMGAIEPIEDGYSQTTFTVFLKKRAPWLVVLFFGGFLSTQALQSYQTTLGTLTELSFYLPLIISSGGNSGSQSSTLVIRALAVGDVVVSDWWRVLLRELGQGLVLGGMLGALGIARSFITGADLHFTILVATTIVAVVTLGCVIGGMTPIVLHRLKLDPATSSNPFIATMVDAAGIIIYMSLARVIMAEALVAAGG